MAKAEKKAPEAEKMRFLATFQIRPTSVSVRFLSASGGFWSVFRPLGVLLTLFEENGKNVPEAEKMRAEKPTFDDRVLRTLPPCSDGGVTSGAKHSIPSFDILSPDFEVGL